MKRLTIVLMLFRFVLLVSANESDFAHFKAEQGGKWSILWNVDGTMRSLYGKGTRSYSSADSAAQRFLSDHRSLLGIVNVSDLRLTSVERSENGTDFTYQQNYRGLPVAGGYVSVHVDQANRLIGATNEYIRGLHGDAVATNTLECARETARHLVADGTPAPTGDLMLLDPGDHHVRPVWKIEVDSVRLAGGSWQVYVDARRPNFAYMLKKTFTDADGHGNVWLENPVATPQRQVEIFPHMDDSTLLSGQYAKIYDANFTHTVFDDPRDLSTFTTAADPGRNYDFVEGDARLTEAMAYFGMNRVHDQWKQFGFRKLNARAPIFVNVAEEENGSGFDNAFYSRSFRFRKTGIYVFGAGSRLENFGLDSDVYYHEYGHGVLDHMRPHFFDSVENNYPFAFHEAFGDISAAAINENPKLGEFALRLKDSHKFVGRDLNNRNRYPRDVIRPRFNASEPHYTGLIVGGAWWDLQEKIGSFESQRILFRSLTLLPSQEIDFFDVRDAMLAADENLNDGKNAQAIADSFSKHGLKGDDPGQPAIAAVSGLKTAKWNFRTDVRRLKTSFKKGDYVTGIISYRTSQNLTPGYNFVPVDVNLSGPCDSCVYVVTWPDEAKKGTHTNASGAIQVLLITQNAVAGKYRLSLRSRLGGTKQVSQTLTTHFTIR